MRDVRRLSHLLDERIEQVDPGPGVEAMRLVLPLVESLHYGQQASDVVTDEAAEVDLSELVDRLMNRLGPSKVYRLAPAESDVPERSQFPVPVYALAGAAAWVTAVSACARPTTPWPA